jgi:hypothetical protein
VTFDPAFLADVDADVVDRSITTMAAGAGRVFVVVSASSVQTRAFDDTTGAWHDTVSGIAHSNVAVGAHLFIAYDFGDRIRAASLADYSTVWDVATSSVWSMAVQPSTGHLWTLSNSGELRVRDPSDGSLLSSPSYGESNDGMAWGPDGMLYIASLTSGNGLDRFNPGTGTWAKAVTTANNSRVRGIASWGGKLWTAWQGSSGSPNFWHEIRVYDTATFAYDLVWQQSSTDARFVQGQLAASDALFARGDKFTDPTLWVERLAAQFRVGSVGFS